MGSEFRTGSLLKCLAASKPGGTFLEIGTGAGLGAAWLLAGMDADSTLDTVENDERPLSVARRFLSSDRRLTFHHMDGARFLEQPPRAGYDLLFADSWPGKFTHLEKALALVKAGGIYLVDDLLPQANWPEEHASKIPPLLRALEDQPEFISTRVAWASGLMMLVRKHTEPA
jgi:predicted O-methyltransferase YrrM